MKILPYSGKESLDLQIMNMDLDSTIYVADVPNEVYHSVKGWSSSHGKIAFLSENRLYRYLHKPKAPDQSHYVFGEMVHDSVRLSDDEITGLYCADVEMYGGGTNTSKAIKICLQEGYANIEQAGLKIDFKKYPDSQEILDKIGGRVLASIEQIDESRVLANLLRSSHHVANALEKYTPIFELSIFRKGPDGFVRKCRPDLMFEETKEVFDWKSTRDIIWKKDIPDRSIFVKWEIKKTLEKFDYLFSAAWYMDVLGWIDDGSFMFVFADKDALEVYPPYLCRPGELHDHRIRCLEAIKAIKSMKSKIVEGKIIKPLTTFLPNDDSYFEGGT